MESIYKGVLPNVRTPSVSASKNTWKHNTANDLFPVNVMCHIRAKRKEKTEM